MKASIIIPAYNAEDTIEKAINSALDQTISDCEVIVIDDGSTDNTWEACEQYGDLINLISQENKGVASARNTGLLASEGDFVLPLDADDLIDRTYLEKTIPLMTDSVGVVSTDMQRFGINNDRIAPELSSLRSNGLPVTSLIRQKAIFEIGGYDPAICYEDWDLWLRLLKNGWKFVFLNEPLFYYRCRPDTRNAMQTKEKLRYEQQIWERHA